MKFKKILLGVLPNLVMFGVAIAIVLCVSLTFSVYFNRDFNFWLLIVRTIALVLILISISNIIFNSQFEDNEEYVELKNKNSVNIKKIDTNITDYLDYENREEKKRVYKKHIQNKLEKLDKKSTECDRRIYFSGSDDEKANNKYCVERLDLISQRDPENLEKMIDTVDIKYNRIYENELYSSNSVISEDEHSLKKRRFSMSFKILLPKIVTFTCFSVLLGCVGIESIMNFNSKEIIFNLLSNICMIIGAITYAVPNGKRIFDNTELTYERKRYKVLDDYSYWNIEHPTKKLSDELDDAKRVLEFLNNPENSNIKEMFNKRIEENEE